MKHIILSGDPAQVNRIFEVVLQKLGNKVKSASFVNSVIVLPSQPQSSLKILGNDAPAPVQFANIASCTVLYQLPNDAELPQSEYMPQESGG